MTGKRDVEIAFERLSNAGRMAGLKVDGWQLYSASNGGRRSYVLMTLDGSTQISGLPPFGHIGSTSAEAENYLHALTAAFTTMAYGPPRPAKEIHPQSL